MSEEGFHEIQLSGKQLVFLFMATTIVSVVIFLLGVMVGRRVPPETLVADATGTTLDGALGDVPAAGADGPAPSAEPPPPVPEGPDQFSYHQRLQQQQAAAAETVATPAPSDAPPPAQEVAPPPAAPPTGGEWFAQIGAFSTRAAAESVVASLKRNNFPGLILEPTPGSPNRTFRVRVGPYRERREAEAIAGRLQREHQYKPIVTR